MRDDPVEAARVSDLKKDRYHIQLPVGSMFVSSGFKPPKCYLGDEHDDIVLGWIAKCLPEWPVFCEIFPKPRPDKHKKTKFKSLDTSIMELADDIAYGLHDLEDAIGLRRISRRAIRQRFEKRRHISAAMPCSGRHRSGIRSHPVAEPQILLRSFLFCRDDLFAVTRVRVDGKGLKAIQSAECEGSKNSGRTQDYQEQHGGTFVRIGSTIFWQPVFSTGRFRT
ncbi:hypothetical protein K1W69_06745 [Hoeflea sp. WL0058]|uniref:Uncharacterized protein n=1 Tax=Flavimaribacter sediminis TaxID=2865987 RepID=A0AAE2ZLW7_9HYPH|nr:hypothetical protein [Flavimaribacter sediminis]MBW8636880.1 hypothetical protein [Flavimaribacter sediminis]